MPAERAMTSVVVKASPQLCAEAILDFEAYPQWQGSVKNIRVLERDEHSATVNITIDLKVKKVNYTLRYLFDDPALIRWEYVEGDITSTEGEYRFTDLGDGTTELAYELSVEVRGFVPGPIKTKLREVSLTTFIKEFKTRVERTP